MALSERSRQEMYQAFEKSVGKEPALTLLEHLPPVGWADVVTKEYVDFKFDVMSSELTTRFAETRSYIDEKLKSQFIALVSTNAIVVGLLLTIFKLGK